MTAIDQDLVFKRMEYATEQHAKIMVENADLRAELAAARAEIERLQRVCETYKKGINEHKFRSGCACHVDVDGETILEWCAVHAEVRNELAAARAEIERLREELKPVEDVKGFAHSKEELSECELEKLMRDPAYWRDQEPGIVAKVREGFRKLYDDAPPTA